MAVSSIKEVVDILAEAKLANTGNVLQVNGDRIEWAPITLTQGPAGPTGVGIASADIVGGQLIITNTLGAVINVGRVVPDVREVALISMAVNGDIVVSYSNGSTQTVGNVVNDAYTKAQMDAKLNLVVELADKGVAGGVASLDDNGKVPVDQMPVLQLGSYNQFVVINNFMELLNTPPFPSGTAVYTKQDKKLQVFLGGNHTDSSDYVQIGTATGGSQLPAPYSFSVNGGDESLQLTKAGRVISSWSKETNNEIFKVAGDLLVGSGVVEFGSNHTIADAGNDLIIINENRGFHELANAQSVSVDGSVTIDSFGRMFYPHEPAVEPNGAVQPASVINGEYSLSVTRNYAIFSSTFVAAENITGSVQVEVRLPNGKLLWTCPCIGNSFQPGSNITTVPGRHFYGYSGDNYTTSIREVLTGRIVKVRSGATNPSFPYRLQNRRYWDQRNVVLADENGKIDSTYLDVAAVDRKTVSNQAARLALPKVNKLYIVIQTDTSRLYYLDQNLDPAVLSNWVDGGSTAAAVASFKGRVGAVMPQAGDYTAADVGAMTAPPADGQRRVLYGATPVVETLKDILTVQAGEDPTKLPVALSVAQGLNSKVKWLEDNYFDETEIKAFANQEAHAEFDVKFTGIDTEINLLKANTGAAAGIKAWTLNEAYGKDVLVSYLGGIFASNTIIPISTPFTVHNTDANAWRPMVSGIWNATVATAPKVLDTTLTETAIKAPNGKALLQLTPTNVLLRMDSTNSLSINSTSSQFIVNNATALTINQNSVTLGGSLVGKGSINPNTTNTYDIGAANLRWATIYAYNALNLPSDKRLKKDITSIPDALLDVWGDHVNMVSYKMIEGNQLTHAGVIAQDVIAAFDAAGIDWKEWSVITDGDTYGVAYSEVQIIENAYQRRKIAHLEALVQNLLK